MDDFLSDLKAYLIGRGFDSIWRDFLPDLPDKCTALFLSDSKPAENGDGSKMLRVCIQARDITSAKARAAAQSVAAALDSGPEETLIPLGGARVAVARPRSGPLKLKEDDWGRVVYSAEADIWINF